MMRVSLYVTDNQTPQKSNKKQSYQRHKYLRNKRTFCALICALFVHCLRDLFQPFPEKSFFSVEIKCLG